MYAVSIYITTYLLLVLLVLLILLILLIVVDILNILHFVNIVNIANIGNIGNIGNSVVIVIIIVIIVTIIHYLASSICPPEAAAHRHYSRAPRHSAAAEKSCRAAAPSGAGTQGENGSFWGT